MRGSRSFLRYCLHAVALWLNGRVEPGLERCGKMNVWKPTPTPSKIEFRFVFHDNGRGS